MNVKLVSSCDLTPLQGHTLQLWSKIQSYETIFIIEVDMTPMGYIAYQDSNNTITKFEIVESFRNQGIGSIALQQFLKMVKPYTDRVILHPISDSLYKYYEQFGFRKRLLNNDKMICKL